MKTIIEYVKSDVKVYFKNIKDKECFYSNGTIYMKILKQDLDFFEIKNINSISILNAGLTFFEDDEIVNLINKKHMKII